MASSPDNVAAPQPASQPASHGGCHINCTADALEANFDSDPAHIASVRTAIESLCEKEGFDTKATGEIGLVVNEAIANVIRHAYGSAKDQPIRARAQLKDGGIEITLQDWGNGKRPLPPAQRKPPDPMTPGGLGLVCMHGMMDQIVFTPQPRGMLLTMSRKRRA